jgi:hypothetical protein
MRTKYFKHAAHSPFFSLQNAVCFIILLFLFHVLFTFYIQGVLKFKNKFGSIRVKVDGTEYDYEPPFSIETKNEWSYISYPSIRLRGMDSDIFS